MFDKIFLVSDTVENFGKAITGTLMATLFECENCDVM
jgi:hypothetical protein